MNVKTLILCSLFAALTAVGAFIRIPMPYFDYITLQTLFVLLAGMLLGAKRASLSMLVYVLVGLAGVPIFAGGGGITYILRPSFGYLVGFIIGSGVTGYLIQRKRKPEFLGYVMAGLAGLLVIYICGISYRYIIMNFYMATPMPLWLIFLSCLPIEIPKDILMCLFTAYLAKRIRPILYSEQ